MNERPERELIERCIAGEEEAWREWVRRYLPVMEGAAREALAHAGTFPSPELLDEICARVYVKLLENRARVLKTFRWESSFSTWLSRVVRSDCRMYLRSERNERGRREKTASRDRMAVSPDSDPHGSEPGGSLCESLKQALDRLSEEDRTALLALYVEGKKYDEIARERNVPMGTLAARISRAKKFLLSRLNGLAGFLL